VRLRTKKTVGGDEGGVGTLQELWALEFVGSGVRGHWIPEVGGSEYTKS